MSNYPKDRIMNPGHEFISENSKALGSKAFALAKWGRITQDKHDELCLIRMDLLLEAAKHRAKLTDFKVMRALQFAENQLRQILGDASKENGMKKFKALQKLAMVDVRRRMGGVS